MTVKPANIIEPSLQLAKAIRGVLSRIMTRKIRGRDVTHPGVADIYCPGHSSEEPGDLDSTNGTLSSPDRW